MTDRIPDSLQEWAKERPFSERLRLSVMNTEVRLEVLKASNKEKS